MTALKWVEAKGAEWAMVGSHCDDASKGWIRMQGDAASWERSRGLKFDPVGDSLGFLETELAGVTLSGD